MHVGLFASFTPGMSGGTEVYIRELTAALAQVDDRGEDRFSLFLNKASYNTFLPFGSALFQSAVPPESDSNQGNTPDFTRVNHPYKPTFVSVSTIWR